MFSKILTQCTQPTLDNKSYFSSLNKGIAQQHLHSNRSHTITMSLFTHRSVSQPFDSTYKIFSTSLYRLSRLMSPLSKDETGHGVLCNSPLDNEYLSNFFGNLYRLVACRCLVCDLWIIRTESIYN
jgi:hypothetical protein